MPYLEVLHLKCDECNRYCTKFDITDVNDVSDRTHVTDITDYDRDPDPQEWGEVFFMIVSGGVISSRGGDQ